MGRQKSWLFDGTRGSEDEGYRVVEGHTTKLNADAQGKHIPGHRNYLSGRSIFLGSPADAQELIERFAGTGERIGRGDYRERIDFGKVIGVYIDSDTDEKLSTTKGIIHYSKKGAHIVASRPKEEDD